MELFTSILNSFNESPIIGKIAVCSYFGFYIIRFIKRFILIASMDFGMAIRAALTVIGTIIFIVILILSISLLLSSNLNLILKGIIIIPIIIILLLLSMLLGN